VKAAGIKVEAYWPALFAKLLQTRSVDDLILSVGSGMLSSLSHCSMRELFRSYDLIYVVLCLDSDR
jgi:ribosomal protein L12E/L44/L45/RPP1/RPP2